MESFFRLVKFAFPLAIVFACLFGYVLHYYSNIFLEFETAVLSAQWMPQVCLVVWSGSFLVLTFSQKDLPLIGLLLVAIAAYFIGYAASSQATDAIILLAGVTLGKGTCFALKGDGRWKMEDWAEKEVRSQKSEVRIFLIGLIGLLAFASWWRLDALNGFYRWTGLWDNPNTYGMLMGVGVVLSAGLRLADRRWKLADGKIAGSKNEEGRMKKLIQIFLLIAIVMMGVGLVMSYSRGAWLATAVGLLYLGWCYGKLKWRFVLPVMAVIGILIGCFWSRTPDNAPWYVKRMDFGRPSAQHRVAAWKAGFEMMRDHPFGVGWNKVVGVYEKNYSPPEGGAAAITTNDYLMMGTQLGWAGLICFVAYVGLCFKNHPHLTLTFSPPAGSGEGMPLVTRHLSLQAACRAGAIVLLVAFWFDGGLFDLPTAAVFWILVELGQVRNAECEVRNAEIHQKSGRGESCSKACT